MGNKKNCRCFRSTKHARIPTPTVIFSRARARVAVLALVLLSLVVFSSSVFGESATGTFDVLFSDSVVVPIGNGVTFERRTLLTSSGWIQMSVIRVNLSSPGIAVGPVLADGSLTSPKAVTSIADAAGLIAAINGDFFDIGATSAPLSFLAQGGKMIRSPRKDPDFASLAICNDGTGLLGQWRWEGVLRGPNGLEITLAGLNEISVPADLAVIYDQHWSWARHPGNADVWHLMIRDGIVESCASGWPTPRLSSPGDGNGASDAPRGWLGTPGEAGLTIDGDACPSTPSYDGVLYVVLRGHSAQIAQALSPGDRVSIEGSLTPPTPGLWTAFSGKPVLVQDGAIVRGLWQYTGIQSLLAAPRTAVGLSEDGTTLIMAVVDGRLPGARGVTLDELAKIMISLGAHEALNLDGGGSSTAAILDPVTDCVILANRPSGGVQRRVPYAVGVWNTTPQPANDDTDKIDRGKLEQPIPAFISVSVEAERTGNGIGDSGAPEAIDKPVRTRLGSFPSIEAAIAGTPSFLAGPEVSFDTHSKAIFTVTMYDALGRRMDSADIPDDVEIIWEAIPPKNLRGMPLPEELWSVSEDRLSAVLFGSAPGRFEITVRAERSPAPEEDQLPEIGDGCLPFAQIRLAARAVDPWPMGAASGSTPTKEAMNRLALVDDFEGRTSWTGAASSTAIRSVVTTANVEGPTPDFPAPTVDQVDNLATPSGAVIVLEYDLRSPEQTRAAYIRPSSPVALPSGTSAIRMWVYGDGAGHWLRATVQDLLGQETPIDFPRISWIGWRVVEAPIPQTLVPPLCLSQVYVVEFKPELQAAGRIAIDNIAAVLAPTVPQPAGQAVDTLLCSAPGRQIVRIDGVRLPLPWPDLLAEFEQFRLGNDLELVVVLRGTNAVDIDTLGVGAALTDPLEAKLLLEMLKGLADGTTSVVLVQDAPTNRKLTSDMEAMIDGVKVIWRKSSPQ